jgi:hypothetical protein
LEIGLSLNESPTKGGHAINIPHTDLKVKHPRNPGISSPSGDGVPGSVLLPSCLYSNNSTDIAQEACQEKSSESQKVAAISALTSILSPYHKKAAQTLFLNVSRLVNEVPDIGHIAFLTLTFKDNVTDHREAYRRYRSWNTHYFSKHPAFGHYINTKEVQTRGAWHFHILIQLTGNIRDGFDFDAYREWLEGNNRFNKKCPTGNAFLRDLWDDLRENLEQYGLGKIHSLEPIESTAEAIGRYVGKYISKHIENRTEDQKGVRLVNYSRGWLRNSVKFAWNTDNSHEWRRKLAAFAEWLGCSEMYQLTEKLGPGWVYKYLDDIIWIDHILLEKLVNDRDAKREAVVPEFKSNTIQKAEKNKKKREEDKVNPELNYREILRKEKKRVEVKEYMAKLKGPYVDDWLTPENKEAVENQIKEEKVGSIYRAAKREKDVVSRMIEDGRKIDTQLIVLSGERAGEMVPF